MKHFNRKDVINLKAILKYTDCLQDGRNVFNTLGIKNIEILRTKSGLSIYPKITIRIKDYKELNELVSVLNRVCSYEVRVVKVINENNIIKRIINFFV